ncbi:MAG: ABC transporter ATP-binding protein [Acutalibacteraceae bacterium]|nr:ABC transporter ATP-binding protein [Clostridia bacterium]MEE3449600.1 ABC transporter ATP-binding protein [Acutalibacteraceae bacterium]
MDVITLDQVSKYYTKRPALGDTSFIINKGDFFGIAGPKKSGKSTIINLIMDFIRPTSGTVTVMGQKASARTLDIKRKIGFMPANPCYCDTMKAIDVIKTAEKIKGVKDHEAVLSLCKHFNVDKNKRIGSLPLASRKKIAIVIALMGDPELVVMDNAFVALDSDTKNKLAHYLLDLNKENVTVVISDRNNELLQQICSRIAIMRKGSLLEISEKKVLMQSDTRRVSVKTDDDLSALYTLFHITEITEDNGYISFLYKKDINDLIEALTHYNLNDLQITLPSLGDALVRYYEKRLEQEQGGV